MAGDAVFLYPAFCRHLRRQQSLLQPLLRARPAFGPAGRKTEIIQERSAAQVFAQPLVPLWISHLLYDHVRSDAFQHLSGVYGRASLSNCDASVGVQTPVAVGGCKFCGPVDRPVCLWIFWGYADFHHFGPCDNGLIPATVLVRVLPHGDDDPGNLQIEEWKEVKRIWKNRQRR